MALRANSPRPDRLHNSSQCFQRRVRRLIELRSNDCAIDCQSDGLRIVFALSRYRQQARNDHGHLLFVALPDLDDFRESATQLSDAVDEGATAKAPVAKPFSQSRHQGVQALALAYATVALQRLD